MPHKVSDIAEALGAEAFGDLTIEISAAAEPSMAGPDDLALAMSPAYAEGLARGRARVAVVWPGADWQALGLSAAIVAPRARLAMARLTAALAEDDSPEGIHPLSAVAPGAVLGHGVAVGPFAVIGEGARIGAGARIGPHVTIGAGAEIGPDARIGAGVRICARVRIGARVILHPNVVIGADGFSFVSTEASNAERARQTLGRAELAAPADATWHKIHSLGGVQIGDDVEIGANSTVDAGTIRATVIGRGTKIDNLCQIGHNVVLGEDCLLSAQTGVAGSARVGHRVVLGGKSGVADNISIGDDAVLGGAAIALSNVPKGRIMMGYPAVRMDQHIESYKALRRLPRLLNVISRLQKQVPNADDSD